jgi:hypothetical protein
MSVSMPSAGMPGARVFPALSWLGLVAMGALPLLIASFPQDAAGWVLLPLTYAVLMASSEFRRDGRLALAGVVVLTAHHLIAVANAFVGTVPGADADAVMFQRQASELAQGIDFGDDLLGTGTFLYTHLLAFFYRLFGPSLFLGEELSVLAFALSCVVLVRLCGLTGVMRFHSGLLLLFGLSLSGLVFLSVTLRESWQVLFVLLSTDCALRVRERASVRNIAFLVLSAACLGLLHQGLAAYAVFLVLAGVYWGVGTGRAAGILWKRLLVLTAGAVLLLVLAASVKQIGGASGALASGKALEYAQNYRMNSVQDARAAYGIMLDASTPLRFAATLPPVLIQYTVTPFPWQIGSPLDIEAMLEGWVRLALLVTSWRAWRLSTGEARSRIGFLLGLFLTMEFLWALGTINWGTAVRHHVLAYGLLVLTGGPGLLLFLDKTRRTLLSPAAWGEASSQS